MRWLVTLAAALIGILMLGPRPSAQGSLSVKDVMRRVERYVDGYGAKASIVVGTERYQQQTNAASPDGARQRMLLSEIAFVRADAIRGWMGFRDVIEVDGVRVTDRDDRLVKILMESEGRYDEARRLLDESARYNIGSVERNFNLPTTALFFFVPENRDRFKFAARRVDEDGAWEIAFTEIGKPTLVRTPEGQSVASNGTLWVRPEGGTVVRTLLETQLLNARGSRPQIGKGRIDVRYSRVDAANMWLPASMDESFEAKRRDDWERVTGHADYSDYRVFTTSARIK